PDGRMRCCTVYATGNAGMRLIWIAICLLLIASPVARAAVTPSQAEALRGALTPVGAERAGNAAGTIPAWNGGLTSEPLAGAIASVVSDPFAAEQPLFTIDRSNLGRFTEHLPEGALALFARFSDYRMRIF